MAKKDTINVPSSSIAYTEKDTKPAPLHFGLDVVPYDMHWLKLRVKELGKTGAALGRALNIPKERVYEMYRGVRRLQPNEISDAARFLEWSETELLSHIDGRPSRNATRDNEPMNLDLSDPAPESQRVKAIDPDHPVNQASQRPKDIPVLRMSLGGAGGDLIMDGDSGDFIRRPQELADRLSVFGMFVEGETMVPRYMPGELLYLDGLRPPKDGDYVLVEMKPVGGVTSAYLKRLKGRTAASLTVEQYTPPKVFDLPLSKVAKIYRVMPMEEVAGPP